MRIVTLRKFMNLQRGIRWRQVLFQNVIEYVSYGGYFC